MKALVNMLYCKMQISAYLIIWLWNWHANVWL